MQAIYWKIHPHFFRAFSEEPMSQILKGNDNSFRNWSSQNEVTHLNFHKTYTAKTPLTIFRKMFVCSVTNACGNYWSLC